MIQVIKQPLGQHFSERFDSVPVGTAFIRALGKEFEPAYAQSLFYIKVSAESAVGFDPSVSRTDPDVVGVLGVSAVTQVYLVNCRIAFYEVTT